MSVGKVNCSDASTGSCIKNATQMLGISSWTKKKLSAKSESEQMMLVMNLMREACFIPSHWR